LYFNLTAHGVRWAKAGRMQFRSEFFNAFNTPQFGQPNGIGWVSNDSIVPDTRPRLRA